MQVECKLGEIPITHEEGSDDNSPPVTKVDGIAVAPIVKTAIDKINEITRFLNSMNVCVSLPNELDLKDDGKGFGIVFQDTSPQGKTNTEKLIEQWKEWLPADKIEEAQKIMATWNQIPKT